MLVRPDAHALTQALTGQTPPEMMRSKDRASGIPALMHELPELMESLMDFCFSSPLSESREDGT